MKTKAKLDRQQIENMEMTITVTMKVDEWRDVMQNDNWMLDVMRNHISAVLGHITRSTEVEFAFPAHDGETP